MSLSVSSDGTQIVGSPPSNMDTVKSYTPTNIARRDAWWNAFAGSLQTTPQIIYSKKDFSASLPEILAFANSIVPDMGNADRAMGLANWIGGGGIHIGVFQNTPAYGDSSDFLSPSDMRAEGTQGQYNTGELLAQLKQNNPAAHDYLISKLFAKAKKVKLSIDDGYGLTNNPGLNNALKKIQETAGAGWDLVLSTIDATKAGLKAGGDALSVWAWLASNAIWLVPSVLVVGGYIVYRNRETVGKIAMLTPQGRSVGMAMAASKAMEK